MEPLFSLTILVEPDRQRFARFASDAVRRLSGNPFSAASQLVDAMRYLRQECKRVDGAVTAHLLLDHDRLLISCGTRQGLLARLPAPPASRDVEKISAELREAGESTDPELLMRRNRQVSRDLERAKTRAAEEMAALEAALEKKKQELKQSIVRADTDGLTGLLNRRAYDRRLGEAVAWSHRQHQPLSLILLDLDHFKEVNDTHGHQYGDEYLRHLAESLRLGAREGVDHLCRFGGDEFAVIACGDLNAAISIAHRVLELMQGRISAGVAQLEDHETAEALEARADAALYEAKRAGRGRVITAAGQELLHGQAL